MGWPSPAISETLTDMCECEQGSCCCPRPGWAPGDSLVCAGWQPRAPMQRAHQRWPADGGAQRLVVPGQRLCALPGDTMLTACCLLRWLLCAAGARRRMATAPRPASSCHRASRGGLVEPGACTDGTIAAPSAMTAAPCLIHSHRVCDQSLYQAGQSESRISTGSHIQGQCPRSDAGPLFFGG